MWTIVTICNKDPEQNTTLPFNFAYEEDAKALREILVERSCLDHKVIPSDYTNIGGHPGLISREIVDGETKFINVQITTEWVKR